MSEIGEDALEGLDISVLMGGKEEVKKGEETTPSVMNPALEIKEVDEVPITKEEESNKVEDEKIEESDAPTDDKPLSIDDQGAPENEPKDEGKSSPLKVFAEMQREKGLIDYKDEDFEDNEEFIFNKVEETIKSGVNEYKETLPPEIKYLVDNFEEGVPLHDLINLSSQQQEYENIPEKAVDEDQELQRALVRDLLYRSGWSQDKINQKIQRYVDSGVLVDEAKDAHSSLKDIQKHEKESYVENVKKQNLEKEGQYKQWLLDLENHIDSKEEIFSGIKITPKQKKTLYSNITKVDNEGKNVILRMRESDPEFDLKVAYIATVLNWDLSSVKRSSKTKATRSLVDSLSTSKPRNVVENEVVDFGVMQKSLR